MSGTIAQIHRYPVKSMRGEQLDSVFVAFTGVMGDRVYGLINDKADPAFPWHTAREQEPLLLYTPRFNAGVDIKEMQRTEGFGALVGANRGCYAAFKAVYECEVPVIAAVHGYCLGGGIGLVGNADIIVASDDATFSLPEVDRGALGAATHLARLVPQHKMRSMVYTCTPATAHELNAWGSVLQVVPRAELRDAALAVAQAIADKPPAVIRAAKASLNGIDPVDVNRSYRFEQGFTFELNLIGEGDRARDAFVGDKDKA